MRNTFSLTNAILVLADRVLEDSVLIVEDGCIKTYGSIVPRGREINCNGAMILPGLVDLHGDALEKEIEPRPGVYFPIEMALRQIDLRCACNGITTAFHAISFAGDELGIRNPAMAEEIVNSLHKHARDLRADHRLHCRYEITDVESLGRVRSLVESRSVSLLSFMDHTPGQGQFRSVESYHNFLKKTYSTDASALEEMTRRKQDAGKGSFERITTMSESAREAGVCLASHDDDCIEKINALHEQGVRISEFPINLETALHARDKGWSAMVGAPNLMRGKSSGNGLSAEEGLRHGVADILVSDYSPAAMLPALFRAVDIGLMDLPTAVSLASRNPARAVGLDDRGEIKEGLRADLIAVRWANTLPIVENVWKEGVLTCS